MEKRLLLALVLMTVAMVVTNILFPPAEPPQESGAAADSVQAPAVAADLPELRLPTPVQTGTTDTVVVRSDLYRHVFSGRGAALLRTELLQYPSYAVPGSAVQLVPSGVTDFLTYSLVVGGDTIQLSGLPFTTTTDSLRVGGAGGDSLVFSYPATDGLGLTLRYDFTPDEYLIRVSGRVEGLGGRSATLLTGLGTGLAIHEHPDHRSEREFAIVTGIPGRVDRLPFRRVEQRQLIDSPLTWAGIKDKYFLAVVIGGTDRPLERGVVAPAPPAQRVVDGDTIALQQVRFTAAVPVANDGGFRFDAYLGPQDYERLSGIGYDLEDVTPYGYRWLQPVIRPLAAAVLWVLNTLHDTLGIAYGWVLVIFGVLMRIVLWPLNAKAMRAQMKNMGVQPLIQEIREKYGNDPQKQQEAMLLLYKEHGFNPLAGCLPLLVPFPVLITLFFVFQNTIAFRGASFLWLPDLSLRDPLYLLPILLVVSSFGLQWVMSHMSGMEQNPQMKMMMYFMPIMMGAIFFMLPAGLNLYYAVTQLASIPQQVLISKERKRAQEELKKSGGPKLNLPSAGGGGGSARKRAKGRR